MSDNESTPESTPESTAPGPLLDESTPESTHPLAEYTLFLVGGTLAFQRFCHNRGLNPRSDRVRRVAEAYQLRGRDPKKCTVLFLLGWQDALPRQWREIYNVAIARGLAKPGRWGADR